MSDLHVTRCPVPTASGFAADHGWLAREPELSETDIAIVQDLPDLLPRHFDHELSTLVREGGNIPALWAAARGGHTRLIALTWVDEYQALVARADTMSTVSSLGVPVEPTVARVDFQRATAIKGLTSTLAKLSAELSDFRVVDIALEASGPSRRRGVEYEAELKALREGRIDGFFVKGAQGAGIAALEDISVVSELTTDDSPDQRVNNGTPRTITAHVDLVEQRPEVLTAYLRSLLKVAQWADQNANEFSSFVAQETASQASDAQAAYDLLGLRPSLATERVAGLDVQRQFLQKTGFIEPGLHLSEWIDDRPLKAALASL